MDDPLLIAKLAGAAVTFAVGIWIGLGMPGVKRPAQPRDWHAKDRFRATWINRVFFRMDQTPRRFDAGRLIVPKSESEEAEPSAPTEEAKGVVRLRRPDQG